MPGCVCPGANRGRVGQQKNPGQGRPGEDQGHHVSEHDGQVRGGRRIHGQGVAGEQAAEPGTRDFFAARDDRHQRLRRDQRLADSTLRRTQRSGTDLELKNKINNRLEATKLTIQERAAEKLLGAMGLLTEEKMENSSAKDLAQISNQMSQVVRNITPNSGKEKDDGKSKVQIIIHQPKQSREDLFDCIEVRSN